MKKIESLTCSKKSAVFWNWFKKIKSTQIELIWTKYKKANKEHLTIDLINLILYQKVKLNN